jgi:4-hydroxybenzoate polyprenyltransferase
VDIEKDKLHPIKRNRPIPSGRVSRSEAVILSIFLFLGSLLIGIYLINDLFAYIIISYLLINIGYTCCLKNIVILDVFIVSIGFLLRTAAGIIAVDVAFSPWIIIATFLLALLLVIGKRRGELVNLKEGAVQHRQALENYNLKFIDNLLNIITAAAIVTYALYTIADETTERFQTQMLIITTPVIIYVLFRYLYLLQLKNQGEDPINMVIRDKHLVIGGIIYILMVAFIIYLKFVLNFSI